MQPGRSAGDDLQRSHRGAGGGKHGPGVGLGVEHVDRRHGARPVAAGAVGLRQRAAQARGGGELVFGLVALEYLADLEQRDIANAAIGIALRRHDQARQQARPHVGELRGDRVGQCELALAAAEQLGLALRHERPRHRFDESACRKRALGLAGALLDRGQHWLARILATRERRRLNLVDADDAHDLFDDVGAAVYVRAP